MDKNCFFKIRMKRGTWIIKKNRRKPKLIKSEMTIVHYNIFLKYYITRKCHEQLFVDKFDATSKNKLLNLKNQMKRIINTYEFEYS